ncbi:MAG TPA: SIR2 family protein [Candidatus Paceibacterota bacterium]|nr:SIR2 family protein [Verrucomicrobiota bacterium]HRY49565.1 SIR2 family protein [Candidatus Paceibacterota bacterium]HRZ55780.1 SIR2 family protein [Candidatus Paceibacterota bacterium]
MPDPAEEVVKLAQKCIEKVPVIVLGSGASRPFGISGMPELQHCLLSHVNPTGTSDSNLWRNFTDELRRCNDLELALHNVHLSPSLEAEVVKQTRRLMLDDDLKVFASLLTGQVELPLSALLRHLLRSTHSSVTVVTTNYDRLAEYAADAEGLEHTTGFTHGYYRSFGTQAAPTQPSRGSRLVEVLKVHGSVDWFQDANGTALCLPDSAQIFPASRDCPILRKTSCLGFEMAGFGYPAEKRVFFRLPLHASSPKQ